jgi:predicted MPP superfamily phosphohydrolase
MTLNILHISDVHFSASKLKDFEFVRDALLKDLPAQIENVRPHLVIFSGDIVHAGGKDDDFYLAHQQLVEPVLKLINLPADRFFIVPGNHDVDRDEVRNDPVSEDGQFTSLSSREALNAFIDQRIKKPKETFYFSRLNKFNEYRQMAMDAPYIRDTHFFTTHKLKIDDTNVGIACLNSAWRSTGEEDRDYGRLLIGERAISEATSDLQGCDLRLAIFHHPLSWLREFDREDCRPLLLRDFDVILTGHMHRQSPEYIATPMGRAVISEGGALYVNRRWFNGYCLIQFNREESFCKFTVRRYEDQRKEFDAANNVSAGGDFTVSLRGSGEIAQYVSNETVLQKLRPIWDEMMWEHITSAAPGTPNTTTLDELYVSVGLSAPGSIDNSQTPLAGSSDRIPSREKVVSETDVINSSVPAIIYGGSESGKTTLGYQLGRLAGLARGTELRVPVFIDLSLLKAGTHQLERAIRDFISKANVPFSLNENLQNGAFFIVIDNFERARRDKAAQDRKIKMIEEFIAKFPKNKFVFLADRNDSNTLGIARRAEYAFKYEKYYLQPLTRKNIRVLANSRLKSSGLANRKSVDSIVTRIDSINLPKTPYIVSMVLVAFEKDRSVGPINEATLLERFVEALLNRAALSEVERASIDYKLKEAFLAHLARYMIDHDDDSYAQKNDLISFTVEFFKARSWHFDAAEFIDDLLANGILYQTESQDGMMVAFRYKCLRQFFTARYFQLNRDYLEEIVREDRSFDFVREIDLFTGLTRDEGVLLSVFLDRARRQAEDLGVSKSLESYELKFKYSEPEDVAGAFLTDVRSTLSSDVEIDDLMDLIDKSDLKIIGPPDNDDEHSSVANSTRSETSPDDSFDILEKEKKYFAALTILSTTVRNCELTNDAKLKDAAVNEAANGWSFFAIRGGQQFNDLLDGKGEAAQLEKFRKLKPDLVKSSEIWLKCGLSVIISQIAGLTLGTDKLRSIIASCLAGTDEKEIIKRIILFFLLIEIAFAHGDQPQTQALKLVDDLIGTYKQQLPVLTLLFSKLHQLYYKPNLGDENRRKIEQLMTDIHLRVHGIASTQKGIAGSMVDKFLKTMKSMRADHLRES